MIEFKKCLLDKVYINQNQYRNDIEITFRAISPTKEQINKIYEIIKSNVGHRDIKFKYSMEKDQYFIVELGENI